LLHYVEQLNSEQDKGKAIPLQALGVPEGWGSQISRHSANKGGKVVSLTHWLPSPPGNIFGTHFC
jgi:hypothetical protein